MMRAALLILSLLALVACDNSAPAPATPAPRATTAAESNTIEVTAKLLPFPPDAIIKRELYNYAAVLKYEVVAVHRGNLKTKIIYVAHYNPFKPRAQAADRFVKNVSGTAVSFVPGDLHKMTITPAMDEVYMGGIVDKFNQDMRELTFFALRTDPAN